MIVDHLTSRTGNTDRSTSAGALSRRGFLQVGAAAGGGLMLSLRLPFATGGAEAQALMPDGFAPNAFIRIEREGEIVLTMPSVEMGQGTYTSIPMLVAEELEENGREVDVGYSLFMTRSRVSKGNGLRCCS